MAVKFLIQLVQYFALSSIIILKVFKLACLDVFKSRKSFIIISFEIKFPKRVISTPLKCTKWLWGHCNLPMPLSWWNFVEHWMNNFSSSMKLQLWVMLFRQDYHLSLIFSMIFDMLQLDVCKRIIFVLKLNVVLIL